MELKFKTNHPNDHPMKTLADLLNGSLIKECDVLIAPTLINALRQISAPPVEPDYYAECVRMKTIAANTLKKLSDPEFIETLCNEKTTPEQQS